MAGMTLGQLRDQTKHLPDDTELVVDVGMVDARARAYGLDGQKTKVYTIVTSWDKVVLEL